PRLRRARAAAFAAARAGGRERRRSRRVLHLPLGLDRVLALVLPGHPVLRQVPPAHPRLFEPRPPAPDGRAHRVLKRRDAAVGSAIRLHRGLDDPRDGQRAAPAFDLVADRDELDALDLPDERLPEIAERTAELAGERLEQRAALLLAAALVDQRRNLPVAGEHVARDVAA